MSRVTRGEREWSELVARRCWRKPKMGAGKRGKEEWKKGRCWPLKECEQRVVKKRKRERTQCLTISMLAPRRWKKLTNAIGWMGNDEKCDEFKKKKQKIQSDVKSHYRIKRRKKNKYLNCKAKKDWNVERRKAKEKHESRKICIRILKLVRFAAISEGKEHEQAKGSERKQFWIIKIGFCLP